MASASDATARDFPGDDEIIKRFARADASEDAVVVEPVVGIVQVQLAILRVTVQIDDATVTVRVLPRNVQKAICATTPRCWARNSKPAA